MPRCDFCGSRKVAWRHRAGRDWLACEPCHLAIQRDDREELLDRALLTPVPRRAPGRYARRFLDQARRLHLEFWETRDGPPSSA